jgi:hypothetical protein
MTCTMMITLSSRKKRGCLAVTKSTERATRDARKGMAVWKGRE